MSFSQAIRIGISKYFQFSGRSSRLEFFYLILFYILCAKAAWVIDLVLAGQHLLPIVKMNGEKPTYFALQDAVLLIFAPGLLAAAARRVHDSDTTAWALLLLLVPLIGWLIVAVWLFSEGDIRSNQYGPKPATKSDKQNPIE